MTSKDWDSTQGNLQLYQRKNASQPWKPVGAAIAVMLGRKGVAKNKHEGDLRVPAGIFSLGSAFGFANTPDIKIKLPYHAITNSTICVDDQKSQYYNQIIESNKVSKTDWNSGEEMRKANPQYIRGIVVNYNTSHPTPGAGSCIFMHIWKAPNTPTVGCISMSEDNIKRILSWVDPTKNPVIAIKNV